MAFLLSVFTSWTLAATLAATLTTALTATLTTALASTGAAALTATFAAALARLGFRRRNGAWLWICTVSIPANQGTTSAVVTGAIAVGTVA